MLIRWFSKRQLGSAWGLVTMAGNIGQSLSPVLLSYLAAHTGWKSAFTVPAAISLLVAPVAWALVRDKPAEAAAEPDAAKRTAPAGLSTLEAVRQHVLPSVPFWLLCTVSALAYLLLKGARLTIGRG